MASSSSTSSADATYHHALSGGAIPSPPPPTPSNQPLADSFPTDDDAALSRLLHQLLVTPTLSHPPPRRSLRTASPPPVINFDQPLQSDLLRSAASDFGFFHLAGHGVPSDLADAALGDCQSLLQSPWTRDNNIFSLGFNHDDLDEGDGDSIGRDDQDRILVLDSGGNVDGDVFASLPALREFGKCLEKAGLGVVEMLSSMEGGFSENPFEARNFKPRCLLWVSSYENGTDTGSLGSQMLKNKCYPYVVGLQYEMSWWRHPFCAVGDSGERISIAPISDSIFITLGDIAQVWSNGRFKKVSRPRLSSLPLDGSKASSDLGCISLTVLVTVSLDSVISPLLPLAAEGCAESDDDDDDDDGRQKFHSFCLEEYAWRVYHERLPLKDPLLRYRI